MVEIYEENLKHFTVMKRTDNKAQCRCPAHDDKTASLTISKGEKKTIFHCHAGCEISNILSAAGLKLEETYYNPLNKKETDAWRYYVEKREAKKIEAVYHYHNIFNGNYCFTKLRLTGKHIIYGIFENNRFKYGLPRNTPRKSLMAIYGDLKALNNAVKENSMVFIVEGEKDVDTLKKRGYTAFTYGGVNDWQDDFADALIGAKVYILADNDKPGMVAANKIKNSCSARNIFSKIVIPTPEIDKGDISDYFNEGHSNEDFETLIKSDIKTFNNKTELIDNRNDVKSLLMYQIKYDADGNEKSRKVLQNVRNCEIVLDCDNRFSKKIRFDEFSQQTYLYGSVPWEIEKRYRSWGSYDDSNLFSILQADYGLNNRNDFFDAVKNISRKYKFHPIRNLLDSLEWDGQEHIKGLLTDYLGCEESDYNFQVMKLFMLGAVSRVYSPGCKFDYTMILQGPQGLGKSTFLQMLAMDDMWFNDSLDSLDSDKAAQSLMGSWIVELAELKSLARTAGGVDSVKRFLTATQDKYRVPYERRADIFLRQCVFSGTTNKPDFLQDETGNRRFLIVKTGVNKPKKNLFNADSITDFKSAWSEAVYIYKTEHPALVLPDSCKEKAKALQDSSMTDDGKTGLIEEYLSDKTRTCALEIWVEALHENGRPAKWQSTEINNIVASLDGWEKMDHPYKFLKYGNQRGFQKTTFLKTGLLQSSGKESDFDYIQEIETPFD